MDKHIILVDEDEDDRLVFITIMKQLSVEIEVSCFKNCNALIEQFKISRSPDLIFVGLNEGLRDGTECLKVLKEYSRLKNIPLYAWGPSNKPYLKKKAIENGAETYVEKSANINELRENFSKIINGWSDGQY